MARMKVTPWVGCRRGPPPGVPSTGTPPSPRDVEKRSKQLEGLEAAGKLPGSPPMQALARMAAEVGPSMSSQETSHIRPTVGGNASTKNSPREIKKALEVLVGDNGSPQDPPVPEEY